MKRKIEVTLTTCLDCPYFRKFQTQVIGEDKWVCYYDQVAMKTIIMDKQIDVFSHIYPSGFPSFCPLEITEHDLVSEEPDGEDDLKYKWVLRNAITYDLRNVVAYKNVKDGSWSFFAIRNSTGRTTDTSYETYASWEAITKMFEKEYGFGPDWGREPLKQRTKK